MEHRYSTPLRPHRSHRWRLVTFAWDFRSPSSADCGELWIDAGQAAADLGTLNDYAVGAGNAPTQASDITVDDVRGAHWLALGHRRAVLEPYGDGWMLRLKMSNPAEFAALMTADQYEALVSKAH